MSFKKRDKNGNVTGQLMPRGKLGQSNAKAISEMEKLHLSKPSLRPDDPKAGWRMNVINSKPGKNGQMTPC